MSTPFRRKSGRWACVRRGIAPEGALHFGRGGGVGFERVKSCNNTGKISMHSPPYTYIQYECSWHTHESAPSSSSLDGAGGSRASLLGAPPWPHSKAVSSLNRRHCRRRRRIHIHIRPHTIRLRPTQLSPSTGKAAVVVAILPPASHEVARTTTTTTSAKAKFYLPTGASMQLGQQQPLELEKYVQEMDHSSRN